MSAVRYRLLRVVRSSWRSSLWLTMVVVLISAVVLALSAGASRTGSAPDRYTDEFGGGYTLQVYQDHGRPRTAEIARLPAVASTTSVTFIFGALGRPGSPPSLDASTFFGSTAAVGTRVVAGRNTRANRPYEFVATPEFLTNNHVRLGQKLELHTLTQAQANKTGFATKEPAGPVLPATLVGIVDGPSGLDDPTPAAFFSPTLGRDRRIGVAVTIALVALREGQTTATFRKQLEALPQTSVFSIEPATPVSPAVRTAVRAQARGLWILALLAAFASAVVLGQLITRSVRSSDEERYRLSAIGVTSAQMFLEAATLALVPITVGIFVGAGLSTLASGRFPSGFVRRIEPAPGFRVDPSVLVSSAIALFVLVAAATLIGLAIGRRVRAAETRPSPTVEAFATHSPSASAGIGVRFAFTRARRDVGSVRTVVIGLAALMLALVGTLTFAVSLQGLIDHPERYGVNYDADLDTGQQSFPPQLKAHLLADPHVEAITLYTADQGRVGSRTLRLVGMQRLRGSLPPVMASGSVPSAPDEIALGRLAARSLHAHVGKSIAITRAGKTERFKVTGITVVPSIGVNEGIGQDGVVTVAGLQRFDPSIQPYTPLVRFRGGITQAVISAYSNGGDTTITPPAAIANLSRIRAVPYLLALLLGVLLILTVAHEMLVSVQRRRGDVAVLRSLGAGRGWVGRCVHWQATALVLVPLVVGVPLGIIAGKFAFRLFADSIGTLDDAALPFGLIAGVCLAAVVLANAVAELPAWRARRLAPAALLHAE